MIKVMLLLLMPIISTSLCLAQVVTVDPPFPTQNDDVTITFNAALGNGDLTGISPIYIHSGLITENSTNLSDWQYVVTQWGTANPDALMTAVGENLFEISFDIQDFYGFPDGEEVYQLAFVFRNASGTVVGRNEDGSDIFIDLYSSGLNASILEPSSTQVVFEPAGILTFSAAASEPSDITLYLDSDMLIEDIAVTSLTTDVDFTGVASGDYWLWMEAVLGTETISDSVKVVIQGDPMIADAPINTQDGINYLSDQSVVLQIYAPQKQFIYVIGDFNNWEFGSDYLLKQMPEGDRFWIQLDDLIPGQEYRFQYSIDEIDMRVADLYADKILDPFNDSFIPDNVYPDLIPYPTGLTSEIVSVFQTAQTPYLWESDSYQRPDQDNLVIYELLIRDFSENHSYQSVIERLPYLDHLGINAIELLPFTEFEGNESWGYNPMFYFAPDKFYGRKNDLKALIDSCHLRGIAVIQDVVFNHSFGQNPQLRMYSQSNSPSGPPSSDSPYFNVSATHPFSVGYDYNHSSPAVQQFVQRNLKYWSEEYHIDGFRFDLSKGFTQNVSSNVATWNQYDQSRVDNWLRIRDEIHAYDDQKYIILEHLGGNPEESILADNNMMLWGNMNASYNQNSMGYQSNANLSWADYQARGWNEPHLITYAESHDEERLMFKNLEFGNSAGNYNVTDLSTSLARQEAIAAFLILLRGPKMIWQFGELGYDYSINHCPDGSIDENCRTANKPIRWDYYDHPARQHLYKVYSALNHLKTENEAFLSDTYTYDVSGLGKRLIIEDDQMDVVILANFGVTPITIVPGFTHTGTWYNYLQGTSITEDNLENGFLMQPGEYRVYTDIELETPDITVGLQENYSQLGTSMYAFPNPFNNLTQISYKITKAGKIMLHVIDVQGRIVSTLAQGHESEGNYVLTWDGRDAAGLRCPGGVYLIRLISENDIHTSKLIYQY